VLAAGAYAGAAMNLHRSLGLERRTTRTEELLARLPA
jgi:hypothetical protein